jgi:hypothetical protein
VLRSRDGEVSRALVVAKVPFDARELVEVRARIAVALYHVRVDIGCSARSPNSTCFEESQQLWLSFL